MTYAYQHWDVFTGEPLLGNQLAVFTDAQGLDAPTMQRVAREMNFSESTFVLRAEAADTDIRLRIFTPMKEMPMAGHPTIGSTFALARTGHIAPRCARFVFGLNVGPTPVDLEWEGERLRFAWMTQGLPQFGRVVDDRALVAAALGVSPSDLVADLPVQVVSCGYPLLFVPLTSPQAVDRALCDASMYRRLSDALGDVFEVFVFARLPEGSDATAYSRMFAPGLGITEDPATGAATGPLGCYLLQYGLVGADAAGAMVSLQGVAMGRRSRLHMAIAGAPGAITRVQVGGEAVLVGTGELYL